MWSASNKEHIHKSSIGRADMAHWPNHGPDMDRECLAHAIPGCTLLSEWSKIKHNPHSSVRFNMPSSGQTKRRRVEKKEDAYADSLPPSSPPPAEDAAANTGAHVAPPQCPESHLIGASHFQKIFDGHLPCSNKDITVFSACICENAGLVDRRL